jgi:hypothetical protein
MSKLSALALSVSFTFLTACSAFTWQGQRSSVSPADASRGLKDLPTLTQEYETAKFFTGVRRRMDGRANAFGRDLDNITALVDRHFFNYSADDPYVNFPTEYGPVDNSLRSMVKIMTPMPLAQDLMRR